jgi:hypothetical protein
LSIGAWTGLAWFLSYMALKCGTLKLKFQLFRLRIFSKCDSPSNRLMGHFLACFGHFHEMAILELLFLMKFSTTLLKVASPCKISKLDFLNGQTKAFQGQNLVNNA